MPCTYARYASPVNTKSDRCGRNTSNDDDELDSGAVVDARASVSSAARRFGANVIARDAPER